MKILISTLILGLTLAGTSHAEEARVTKAVPFTHEHPLSIPTTFNIENSMGEVVFEAIDGSKLTISGTTEGEEAITLAYEETERGKYQIVVTYPPGSSSSVNISSISTGGDIIVGDVFVSGPDRGIRVGPLFIPGFGRRTTQTSVVIGPQPLLLKVGVPRALLADLRIKMGSGDMKIEGPFPGAQENKRVIDLVGHSGKVSCRNASAYSIFKIETGSGNIEVDRVHSNYGSIWTNSGVVELNEIHGAFTLRSGSGNITSRAGTGPLTITTSSGRLSLDDPDRADLHIESGSGDISANGGSGETRVTTNSGKIDIGRRSKGPVSIDTGSGDIELNDIGGDLRIDGRSSEIKAARVAAEKIDIETGSGNVKLKQSTGHATIVTRSGKVKVSNHTNGSVNAKTGSGNITFSNPDASVIETASSRSGTIERSREAKASSFSDECKTGSIFDEMKKPGWPFN